MLVYLLFWSLFFLFASLSIFNNRALSAVSLFSAFFILFYFTGLRYYSANDYLSYMWLYDITPSLFQSNSSFSEVPAEVGYIFLNSVFKTFEAEGYFFLFVLAFFSLMLKFVVLNRIALYPLVSAFVYFSFVYYNSEFIQVRWAFALCFLYFSAYFFVLENKKATFIFIVFAALFHIASLMFVFLFLISFFVSKYKLKSFTFLSGLLLFFSSNFINVPELLLNFVPLGNGGYFLVKVKGYLENAEEGIALHVQLRYFLSFILCYIFFKIHESNIMDDKKCESWVVRVQDRLLDIYLVSSSICFLFMSFPILANRIYVFNDFVFSVIIINFIAMIRDLPLRLTSLMVALLVCYAYHYLILNSMLSKSNVREYSGWLKMLY
ncbi:EpsG family protein [Pseudoalteromonas sp. T1lg122]|uniref:EpsG family protein n=1 Tax=Pseudoalteromonas sp. T1lg122 TaxID=2077094 RepID=UPI000CF60C2B|nr:EpsG family protein [Pseudoalteromonas sp. T1lg122]